MDSDEPQQPAVGESAGQQLKQAREALGLSLNDVADAQHLRVTVIQAIESGHYHQIDSELFLKGYVRAYAKQVGADADALIQTLDLELEPLRQERAKQEQEDPLVDLERRRRKKRRLAKILVILAVLGGISLAAWKLVLEPRMGAENSQGAETEDQSPVEQDPEQDQGAGMEDVSEPEGETAPDDATAPVEAEETADSIESAQTPAVDSGPAENDIIDTGITSASEPSASSEPSDASELSEPPEPSESSERDDNIVELADNRGAADSIPESQEVVEVEPVITESEARPDPVFEESAQPDAVATPVQLEMSFASDCWVQVTDSSGARLVASLQRDGDEVSVSGRPPLDIVIGAVDAVEAVSFAGEPVDLSDFRVVNNRTEFTLTL